MICTRPLKSLTLLPFFPRFFISEGRKQHRKDTDQGSTRMPTDRDGGKDISGTYEAQERRDERKDREDHERRDQIRIPERERDRRHESRNRAGQQQPPRAGTRGTFAHRFFKSEELDPGTRCERCNQEQPHCKTCQQSLPRRHILRRVLGRDVDESEEYTVEGPLCDECEQHIPFCDKCFLPLPADVLHELAQKKLYKEKLE